MEALLQQSQELLDNPQASLTELNAVYVCLAGQPCRTVAKIRYTLQQFIAQPERYALRIQSYRQDQAEKMAEKRYRFTKAYISAGEPNIVLHSPALIVVKKDQLTDEKAGLLAKHPQYSRFVELIPAEKPDEAPAKKKRAAKKAK